MEQVREFFAMSGYGSYVWAAYAIGAIAVVGLIADTRRRLRDSERVLSALESRGGAIRGDGRRRAASRGTAERPE